MWNEELVSPQIDYVEYTVVQAEIQANKYFLQLDLQKRFLSVFHTK